MALQFLLLAALLNAIFYKPLTKALDERDNYIRRKVEARERLDKAGVLKTISTAASGSRRQSQTIVASAQTEAQKLLLRKSLRLKEAQVNEAVREIDKQEEALRSLEQQVDASQSADSRKLWDHSWSNRDTLLPVRLPSVGVWATCAKARVLHVSRDISLGDNLTY